MNNRTIVRGRFAPSPSGRMHLGNVFCALMAWLCARSAGGEIILRLEDLDPDRCRPEYAALLESDLRWLGLDWDAGGWEDPTFRQSARTALYEEYYQKLDQMGLLYPCFCTRALRAASAPHLSDKVTGCPGGCRMLTSKEATERALSRSPSIRVRTPDMPYAFTDGLQGGPHTGCFSEDGDFIVRRSDRVFAYQLAVVVDDALMGVNQVVRGRDLLDSVPKQLLLYQLLGLSPPAFYHIPLLLSPDGRRLSKRDRDLDMGVLREHYSPEEVVGCLAHLCGLRDQYEPLSVQALLHGFSIEKVSTQDVFLPKNLFV